MPESPGSVTAPTDVAPGDRAETIALLARSGFGPTVGQLVTFPLDSPDGTLLVARRHGELAAVAGALSFGTTGWIGALAVAPEHRRAGLGRLVCEAAVAWLRARGAETVLLYATDAGRPLYAGLGFEAERPATAWRGRAAVRLPAPIRPLRPDDRAAVAALDRATTGEERAAFLDTLAPLRGWAVDGPDGLRGAAVGSPYGRGVAIAAADGDAGVALLAGVASGPAAGVVLVPDGNAVAAAALRRWRFLPANAPLRMRLGPPPAWRPDRQYGLFNFFWG
jgi:GNAT superfamily N-acetyltransferase